MEIINPKDLYSILEEDMHYLLFEHLESIILINYVNLISYYSKRSLNPKKITSENQTIQKISRTLSFYVDPTKNIVIGRNPQRYTIDIYDIKNKKVILLAQIFLSVKGINWRFNIEGEGNRVWRRNPYSICFELRISKNNIIQCYGGKEPSIYIRESDNKLDVLLCFSYMVYMIRALKNMMYPIVLQVEMDRVVEKERELKNAKIRSSLVRNHLNEENYISLK